MLKALIQNQSQDPGGVGRADCRQGDSLSLALFIVDENGIPQGLQMTEIILKIFMGTNVSALIKKLSLSQVSAITGYGGAIGASFGLSPTDTAGLPVGNIAATITFEDATSSPTYSTEIDIPSLLYVSAPIV